MLNLAPGTNIKQAVQTICNDQRVSKRFIVNSLVVIECQPSSKTKAIDYTVVENLLVNVVDFSDGRPLF
ncbi:hypothetical protein GCM10009069_09440 [Algimonas arctica]|uniref:Uncharacterized protein n=1 Tax=Algimonas arctica TaxID=1479486 RepID=A0A8J3G1I7_9PROT|nr:hypothetical protein GCM10009069_09440 [Algimonas arctica]